MATAVELLGPRIAGRDEGLVDTIVLSGRRAAVGVLLADGRTATARTDADELHWLDVRVGDIVGVRELPSSVS